MVRHMVLFAFRPEVDEDRRAALLREYTTFPATYPAMRNFTLGRNVSKRDRSFDYAFTVEFATMAELDAYLDSPTHAEHVAARFRPLVAARAIVSYEVAEGAVTDLFG